MIVRFIKVNHVIVCFFCISGRNSVVERYYYLFDFNCSCCSQIEGLLSVKCKQIVHPYPNEYVVTQKWRL